MSPLFKKEASKGDEAQVPERLIPEDGVKHLREVFAKLKGEVRLVVFTRKGENDVYNEYMAKLVRETAELSDLVTAEFHSLSEEMAAEHGVESSPTLLINPGQYDIRYLGAPLGEEARGFVETILRVSLGQSGLSPKAKALLDELRDKREAMVFVTPTCPYCPGQVLNAFKCAIEKPGLVSAACVETGENPDLAGQFSVGSVPHTVMNGRYEVLGLMPEERFAAELVLLRDSGDAMVPEGERGKAVEVDVAIVGAGPAGLTAGIYAERSGLSAVILDKGVVGGQVAVTPVVENYPGFANIAGKKLMEIMAEHARDYVPIYEGSEVLEIKVGKRIEVLTAGGGYAAKALILAGGATWRKLGAPGEDRYAGFGVSYCSSCDGYVYKGKKAVVVGGGNTALTDALHLKNLGVDVRIIHRRDAFRAEKHLRDAVEASGVEVLWNAEVAEILGDEKKATAVRVRDTRDGSEREVETDAVFVAVGVSPNNALAKQIGLALAPDGYVEVDPGMRTSIPRIYAAGDLTGGVRQIVTAVGEGASAALSAFEDMNKPYWTRNKE